MQIQLHALAELERNGPAGICSFFCIYNVIAPHGDPYVTVDN